LLVTALEPFCDVILVVVAVVVRSGGLEDAGSLPVTETICGGSGARRAAESGHIHSPPEEEIFAPQEQ